MKTKSALIITDQMTNGNTSIQHRRSFLKASAMLGAGVATFG